jgi:hypothetical protein
MKQVVDYKKVILSKNATPYSNTPESLTPESFDHSDSQIKIQLKNATRRLSITKP